MVLFCFLDVNSLPLTRSCYTPPENTIDMAVKEEFIFIKNMNRKDNYSFNMGIPGDTSIGLDFSLIHYNAAEIGGIRPDDILFNFWHFTGEYFDDKLDSGISLVVRIPTGPDAYTDEKSRNLSFGNSELKISPVVSLNCTDHEMLVLNLSYTFREGRGEDLYSGFKINPLKSETYKSLFGLNPFYKNTFLDGENLKNDYASISAGLLSSRLIPWIFFTEIYYSSGIYRGGDGIEHIQIEGAGVNPLLLSAGFKYYFSDSFFVQCSDIVNLLEEEGFIKNKVEIGLNIFF